MKQHSKSRVVIAGMVGFSLILPLFAFAQTSTPRGTMGGERVNFCTTIDKISAKVEGAMSEREAKYQSKRNEKKLKIDERIATRDASRTAHRSDWDTQRGEWLAKLTAKASTTEQQAAVTKFISSIDAAVLARRTVVDAAVKDVKLSIETVNRSRQTAVDAILATFKSDRSIAFEKAKADCAANVAPKTVRGSYVAAMKAARENMQKSVKALEARKDILTPFIDIRKAAVEKAVADFKSAIEKAKTELKSAMKSA